MWLGLPITTYAKFVSPPIHICLLRQERVKHRSSCIWFSRIKKMISIENCNEEALIYIHYDGNVYEYVLKGIFS